MRRVAALLCLKVRCLLSSSLSSIHTLLPSIHLFYSSLPSLCCSALVIALFIAVLFALLMLSLSSIHTLLPSIHLFYSSLPSLCCSALVIALFIAVLLALLMLSLSSILPFVTLLINFFTLFFHLSTAGTMSFTTSTLVLTGASTWVFTRATKRVTERAFPPRSATRICSRFMG
jgi:hypothetical protein